MSVEVVGFLIAWTGLVVALGVHLGAVPLPAWWLRTLDRLAGAPVDVTPEPYCKHDTGIFVSVAGELVCRDDCAPVLRDQLRAGLR